MYREVETPKVEKPKLTSPQMNFDTQRFNDNAERIRNALQSIMNANKIHGELQYPPPTMDLSNYVFDAIHTQGDKHPHDVTETEARKFIDDAYFAIIKYKGNSYNYYGKEGAAFVRRDLQTIRTAFKAYEYDNNIKLLLEAFENEFRKERNFLPINFKKKLRKSFVKTFQQRRKECNLLVLLLKSFATFRNGKKNVWNALIIQNNNNVM